jgi:hypothetical protein
MTEEEPILNPPWKELVKVASEWEYGSEVHPHTEIAAIMRLEYPSQKYYENVTNAIEEMISLGKRMVCVKNVGYRVLAIDEHTIEGVWDMKKGIRKMRTSVRNLSDAPTSKMTDTKQRVHENVTNTAQRMFSSAASSYNEITITAGLQRPPSQKALANAANRKKGTR